MTWRNRRRSHWSYYLHAKLRPSACQSLVQTEKRIKKLHVSIARDSDISTNPSHAPLQTATVTGIQERCKCSRSKERPDKSEMEEPSFSFLQHVTEPKHGKDFNFTQNDTKYDIIPSSWILLDSQSTVSVFKNSSFLSNIRASKKSSVFKQTVERKSHPKSERSRILVMCGTTQSHWQTFYPWQQYTKYAGSKWTPILLRQRSS